MKKCSVICLPITCMSSAPATTSTLHFVLSLLQGLQGRSYVCRAAMEEGTSQLVPSHSSVQHNTAPIEATGTIHR